MNEPIGSNILDMSVQQLQGALVDQGLPKFRVKQILQWIHQKHILDLELMTDLPKQLRADLQAKYDCTLPDISLKQQSEDGVVKFALQVGDSEFVETVVIPETKRTTLCISSQAGCALRCAFCETGKMGFSKNLSLSEIIGQLFYAETWLDKNRIGLPYPFSNKPGVQQNPHSKQVTNVVFMGMGEPMLNIDPVLQACELMMNDNAWGLGKRRVTVSTAGVIPGIERLADESDASLAVSLHAANNELRDWLVPINKKYPLKNLMEACRYWLAKKDSLRHITFEYIMIEQVNDTLTCAKELVKLLGNMECKVNLIPMNGVSQTNLSASRNNTVKQFQEYLNNKGIIATIRKQRGADIGAACGQLAGNIKAKGVQKARIPLRANLETNA